MTRHTYLLLLPTLAMTALSAADVPPAAPASNPRDAAIQSAKKAADWLIAKGNEDGTYGQPPRDMPGVVALVLYGLVKSPDKHTPAKTPAVKKSAEFLLKCQMDNGAIALKQYALENYNTSIAIVALKALNDPAHKDALDKALKYVMGCQLDESKGYNEKEHYMAFGGFGYGGAKRADLSNTSFSLEALKAMGVKEDSEAWKNALVFIKRCQDAETNDAPNMQNGENSGGIVYIPGTSEFGTIKGRDGKEAPKPYGNMTYAGIKSLIYCGLDKNSPELKAAWKWVKNNYDVTQNPGGKDSEGYYYYVVAFAKAFAAAGQKEITLADGTKAHWAKDMAAHLVTLQKPDGSFANESKRWMESDPILGTAYALQALNLCIEHME